MGGLDSATRPGRMRGRGDRSNEGGREPVVRVDLLEDEVKQASGASVRLERVLPAGLNAGVRDCRRGGARCFTNRAGRDLQVQGTKGPVNGI